MTGEEAVHTLDAPIIFKPTPKEPKVDEPTYQQAMGDMEPSAKGH